MVSITFAFAFGLLLIVQVVHAIQGQCSAYLENTYYTGYDLEWKYTNTASDCCKECQDNPSCKVFVHVNGICALKSQRGTPIFHWGARASTINPTSESGGCSQLRQNTNLPGNDIRATYQSFPQGCCNDCKATTRCTSFTWYRGVCYLKSGSAFTRPYLGAVSGVVSAPAPTTRPPTFVPTPSPTRQTTAPPRTTTSTPSAAPTPAPTSVRPTPAPTSNCPPRVRQSWSVLTPAQKELFISALEVALDRGLYQRFVLIHKEEMNFNEAHGTCAFLFWHRLYLAAFENMLRSLGPQYACLTLPYWDYIQDYETMKQQRNCNNLESCSPIISDFGGSRNGINSTKPFFDFSFPDLKCVTARPLNHFCEKPGASNAECDHCVPRGDWSTNDMPFEMSFEGVKGSIFVAPNIRAMSEEIENSPHNLIHAMLTGPMVYPGVSPVEPLFFLHHSTIDMFHTIFYHCKVEPLNLSDGQKQTHEAVFQGCRTANGDSLGPTSSVKMRVDGNPVIDATNDPLIGRFFDGLPFQYYKLTDSRDLGTSSYSFEMRGLVGTLYNRCENAPVPEILNSFTENHVVVPVEKTENTQVLTFEDEVLAAALAHGLTEEQGRHEIRKMGLLYHQNCLPGGIRDYPESFKKTWHIQTKPKALVILEQIESGEDPMMLPTWPDLNMKYFGCRGDVKVNSTTVS